MVLCSCCITAYLLLAGWLVLAVLLALAGFVAAVVAWLVVVEALAGFADYFAAVACLAGGSPAAFLRGSGCWLAGVLALAGVQALVWVAAGPICLHPTHTGGSGAPAA